MRLPSCLSCAGNALRPTLQGAVIGPLGAHVQMADEEAAREWARGADAALGGMMRNWCASPLASALGSFCLSLLRH
jgi:hypothetical protein